MEFIEATLNPNFLPKICSKEVWALPPKWRKTAYKKTEKSKDAQEKRRTAVPERTGARAQAHDCMAVHQVVHCSAVLARFYLGCMAVHPCRTPVCCPVFLCFAILMLGTSLNL